MSETLRQAQGKIIPAILPTGLYDFELKLAEIPQEVKLVHIDVLENDVWAGEINKEFEVHLMVEKPEDIIDTWVVRGARRVIIHSLVNPKARSDVEIGLGVELNVPLEDIFPLVPEVDFLNLMSIDEIGEQGHPFNPRVFDRIKQVRDRFPKITISVDGGVNKDNYQKLIEAGADRIIIGSHFKDLWNLLTKK